MSLTNDVVLKSLLLCPIGKIKNIIKKRVCDFLKYAAKKEKTQALNGLTSTGL